MRFKAVVKPAAWLLQSALAAPFLRYCVRDTTNVVYYHLVGEAAPHYRLFYAGCTLPTFRGHLEYLKRIFDFVSLAEALEPDSDRPSGSRPRVAITFDDGFDLRREGVLAVLREFRIRATSFVITSCIGNERLMWRHMMSAIQTLTPENVWRGAYNELARGFGYMEISPAESLLRATKGWPPRQKDNWAAQLWAACRMQPMDEYLDRHKPYFDWDGLGQWMDEGHTVGFHTHTHPYCSRLTKDELADELVRPAEALRARMGLGSLDLSYPFGDRLEPEFERELMEGRKSRFVLGNQRLQRKPNPQRPPGTNGSRGKLPRLEYPARGNGITPVQVRARPVGAPDSTPDTFRSWKAEGSCLGRSPHIVLPFLQNQTHGAG
jgi:peptidoglycan/xylan/chitin deacetylase (PgdA/CDA1 family)